MRPPLSLGEAPFCRRPPLAGPRVEPPRRVQSGRERNALGCGAAPTVGNRRNNSRSMDSNDPYLHLSKYASAPPCGGQRGRGAPRGAAAAAFCSDLVLVLGGLRSAHGVSSRSLRAVRERTLTVWRIPVSSSLSPSFVHNHNLQVCPTRNERCGRCDCQVTAVAPVRRGQRLAL